MPGEDKTGPLGTGPVGRGLGPCGDGTPRAGRGRRFHHGSFGWRIGRETLSAADEKEFLERRKNWLGEQLSEIDKRLQELKAE